MTREDFLKGIVADGCLGCGKLDESVANIEGEEYEDCTRTSRDSVSNTRLGNGSMSVSGIDTL